MLPSPGWLPKSSLRGTLYFHCVYTSMQGPSLTPADHDCGQPAAMRAPGLDSNLPLLPLCCRRFNCTPRGFARVHCLDACAGLVLCR